MGGLLLLIRLVQLIGVFLQVVAAHKVILHIGGCHVHVGPVLPFCVPSKMPSVPQFARPVDFQRSHSRLQSK